MLKVVTSLLILIHSCLIADVIEGKVVGVSDGDSLTLLTAKKEQLKIRMDGIDAPEMGQDFGNKSKQALSSKVFGKRVKVESKGRDKYDRTIGRVFVDGVNINHWMVEKGWAWQYVKYDKSAKLKKAQEAAKQQKLGIWRQANVIAPWEYRANIKKRNALKKEQQTGVKTQYWLNTSTNTRHNDTCKWFKKTKQGRLCKPDEGAACGACGG